MQAGSSGFLRAALPTAGLFLLLMCTGAPAAQAAEIVEGRLHIYQVDDFERGRFPLLYELEDSATGERMPLRVPAGWAENWSTGRQLRAEVNRRSGILEIERLLPLTHRGDGVSHEGWEERFQTQVAGERRALVMVVDFVDSEVSCSDGQIESTMWAGTQSVDGLYRETSYDALSFPADTDGDGQADLVRVTIPNTISESCNSSGWANAANSQAGAAGVDLGAYQHHVYVLPANTDCAWAGLGSLGCNGQCRSWVRTCGLPDVYAHELGHNLGMHHASTDENNDGSIDCEYCDRSDFMGVGGVGFRQVNGPHKQQMGWLPGSQIESIDGQADRTQAISALTTDPAQAPFPQMLTFSLSGGQKYYLTYRARVGYDSNLNSDYHSKTNIHRFGGSGQTLFVGAVGNGQSFSDESTGFHVTQISQDAAQATLLVGAGCDAAAPSFSWTVDEATGNPGQPILFEGTLTNEDLEECAASTFEFAADLPAGWSAAVDPPSLTLAPGESGTVGWTVTPALGEQDGTYGATLQVNGPSADHEFETAIRYTVAGDAPSAVVDLSGVATRRGFVRLRWTESIADGGTISGYRVYRNGQLLGSTENAGYLDARPCGSATCSYEVRSVDSSGRLSAPGNQADVAPGTPRRKGADEGMR